MVSEHFCLHPNIARIADAFGPFDPKNSHLDSTIKLGFQFIASSYMGFETEFDLSFAILFSSRVLSLTVRIGKETPNATPNSWPDGSKGFAALFGDDEFRGKKLGRGVEEDSRPFS